MSAAISRSFVFVILVMLGLAGCEQLNNDLPSQQNQLLLHLDYNQENGALTALNLVNGQPFKVENAFSYAERIPGIENKALRTDGYSTWLSGNLQAQPSKQLSVESWIALESYPSDIETTVDKLSPSSLISHTSEGKGYGIDIDTFGRWWFRASLDGQEYRASAKEPFPLYKWSHVAGVIDTSKGEMSLYLNGQKVALNQNIPRNAVLEFPNSPLLIGKSHQDQSMFIFPLVNALNAAIDETKIYAQAREEKTLLAQFKAGMTSKQSSGTQAIQVPEQRFAKDIHRPVFHAMPPANWTNEPHGLVVFNDQYHIFYQRTPNGPYKTMMHWGHMVSDDLVNWQHMQDALYPTLDETGTFGFDMKGIWSGDVVIHDNTAYAFYTSVNHSTHFNPGISVAISRDEKLEHWQKLGPIIDTQYVEDFRDPYIWQDGNTWHMIIGARINKQGGLDYYTSDNIAKLDSWQSKPFSTVDYSELDIGSDIWEMPVFEPLGHGKHILVVNPIGNQVSKTGKKATRAVYWIGEWQNGLFTPDFKQAKMLDLIHGHLSPTVARNKNDQLVAIGIVDERRSAQEQLKAGWTHTFSLPRVWGLLDDKQTLSQQPAEQLQRLRQADSLKKLSNISVKNEHALGSLGRTAELIINIDEDSAAQEYGLVFNASPDRQEFTRLYYDSKKQQLVLDKSKSTLSKEGEEDRELRGEYDIEAFGKPRKFHIFIDHSIVDIFINDAAALSVRIYPTLTESTQAALYSRGGSTTFSSLESWQLNGMKK